MVVVVPLPVLVIAPGYRVRVQVPLAGRSSRSTLPVATPQMGWVIDTTVGASGVNGPVLITAVEDKSERQPTLLITVHV